MDNTSLDPQQIVAFYRNLIYVSEVYSNNISFNACDLIGQANQASWTRVSSVPTPQHHLSFSDEDDSRGLTEEDIMGNLETRKYVKEEESDEICVICQAEYGKDGERIGGLHCGHEYHVECLKKWLMQNNSCPICKATAVV